MSAAVVAILSAMVIRPQDSESSGATPGFEGVAGNELSVELAERLFGAMREGVLISDEGGRVVFCNARAVEITGVPLADAARQTTTDPRFQPVTPDGRPLAYEERPTAVALRTGRHYSATLGVPREDGTLWIVFNAQPLMREGSDRPFGVITVLNDITEHKEAELALARSEELKSAIMSASLDAVLTLTRDGDIVDLNRSAERLFQVTRSVIGEHVTNFIPPRDRHVWDQLLARLREDPTHLRDRRIEGTGRRSDASEFPIEVAVSPLETGQHQFLVTFVRDITDRKASERRLADARDAALRASVVKSEFLATMSHEIRTPMNGVIGSLDLMLDSDLTPDLAELASIARTAATDLLSIIDDILDLSKIEADKVERQHAPLDLTAIVEGVVDIVAVAARAKGVAVASYVDPTIPPAVEGDSRLVRQVLVNLAGNAVKFTDHGEIVVRAERLGSEDAHALVRFSVQDSGVGIPADAIDTLFEPFTQVDASTTRPHGGSGLGLAISSRLVRLMGGRLSVESEPGRGSTFSFTLPFAIPPEQVELLPPPANIGRPLRVLVVDPADSSAETVERYLRAWGMVPTRVTERAAARERLTAIPAAERFDVAIIAAAAGPDEDAQRLARELHAVACEPAVFVIGLLDAGERSTETTAEQPSEFDAVIGRPVKQSRLYDALAGIQDERGPAQEPPAQEEPAGALTGLRVLIAEDNPVNQQVLLRQIQRLGITAEAVDNGVEAISALERGTYDAILMDCQMPVMDGYAATRAIREREAAQGARRMPIVAVTANAMREDFERCREAGMDDFVAKPVTITALTNAIERAVATNRPVVADDAAPPAAAEEPGGGVDMAALASLQDDLGGPDALARIVRLFLEQLDPQAEQIDASARAGDHESLARIAHRMRSSAATLGASGMADLLAALEAAALDGDAAGCDQLAASFSAQVASTRATFQTVLSELDASVPADG